MAANLSNLLGRLTADQLSTINFEAGLDSTLKPVTDSFDHYLDSLTNATPVTTLLGAQVTMKVGFYDGSTNPNSSDYFTDAAKDNAWQALQLWSGLTGVTFTYVSDPLQANIDFIHYGDSLAGETPKTLKPGTKFSAESYAPTGIDGVSFIKSGLIQIDNTTKNSDGSLGYGDIGSYTVGAGYGIDTLVHEIGHMLGLGHTGDYNGTVDPSTQQRNPTDDRTWSIMSYIEPSNNSKPDPTDPTGKRTLPSTTKFTTNPTGADYQFTSGGLTYNDAPFTPMGLDLFAAQRLDGVPATGMFGGGQTFGYNSNIKYTALDGTQKLLSMYDFNTDVEPVVTFFDSGANNTLDLSGDGTDLQVNLNDGTFSSSAGMTDNLFIEYGTQIDHAIGGAGNDTFTLNARSDTVDGGGGTNTAVFSANRSAYALSYAGADVILTQTATGVAYRLRNIQTYQFADGAATLSDLPRTTWTGPAGGHFGIGTNWSNGQVPVGTSEVRINAGASVVVTQQERNIVDSLVVASGADIDVTSGQFIVNDAAAGTTNDGTIEAETGTSLILAGGLANTGTITLYGGTLLTNSSSVTLSGGGTLTMQGGAIGGRDASGSPLAYDTFTNVDNLIQGSGTIGRAGLLFPVTFVNDENANVVASAGTLQLSGAIANLGILGASDQGTLDLSGAVDQTGGGRIVALGVNARVLLDGGTVTGGSLAGVGASPVEVGADETLSGVTLSGGIVVDAGAKLTLKGDIYADGATIDATAGAIDVSGARLHGGTVKLPAGSSLDGLVLDGGSGGFNLSGATIGRNQTVTIRGSIINTSTLTVQSLPGYGTATLAVSGAASLSGGGTVLLRDESGGASDYLAVITGTMPGDTLENVDDTISGVGQLGGGSLAFVNDASGTVNVTSGDIRLWTTSTRNAGLLEATGGTLLIETPVDCGGGTILAANQDVHLGYEGRAATITAGILRSTGSGRFLVDGSGATLDGSSYAVNAQGLMEVINGAAMTVKGTIANTGSIYLLSQPGYGTATLAVSGAATLQGGGTVTLADVGGGGADYVAAISGSSAADVLTNVDNAISGYGHIGGGGMGLVNSGTITATASTLTLDTGATAIFNHGALKGIGGNLAINSALVTDALVTSASGGTVTFRNVVTNSGGLQFQIGGKVVLDGGTLTGTGFLSTALSASVEVVSTGTIDGTHQNTALAGSLAVDDNATLTLKGAIHNSGSFTLRSQPGYGTATLAVSGAVTLQGGGTVTLADVGGGNADYVAAITGASTTDVLTNADNKIRGYGHIGQGTMGLVNGGIIDATASTLTVDTGAYAITNTGTLEGVGGTLVVNSAVANAGTILAGAAGTAVLRGAVTGSGGVKAADSGTLVLDGGALSGTGGVSSTAGGTISVVSAGTLDGTHQGVSLLGSLAVGNNATLTALGAISNQGAITLSSQPGYGTATLKVQGAATLSGGGTVTLADVGGGNADYVAAITGSAASDTLENVDNAISGYGQIGQGSLTFNNDAAGTVNVTAGDLRLWTASARNAGAMKATGGTLVIETAVDNAGGTISAVGATVQLGGEGRAATVASGTLASSGAGKVLVDGSGATLDGTASGLTTAASVEVHNSAALTVKGVIANSGGILLASQPGYGTATLAVSGAVTLQGGGTVTLADVGGGGADYVAAISGSSASDVLTNVDNAISGYGHIGGGGMGLVNSGTITATASTLTLDTGPSLISNSGLLKAAGGTLAVRSNVANSGQVLAAAGSTVTVSSLIRNNGTVTAAAGGKVVLDGGSLTGTGSLATAATGTIEVASGGGFVEGLQQSVSLAGSVQVDSGSGLILLGTIHNSGAITMAGLSGYGTATLRVSGTTVLQGGGTVVLKDAGGGGADYVAEIKGSGASDVLDNVDQTISGVGHIGQGTMSLVNEAAGTIKASNGSLTLDTGASEIENRGTLLADGGVLAVNSAVANTGLIEARSGTVTLAKAATGALQVDAAGTLVLQDGALTGSTITFTGATGTVLASGPVSATIKGFADGDTLDLVGVSATGTYGNGVLSLASGATALGSLVFAGAKATDVFTTSSDGQGGTLVTRSTQVPVAPVPLVPAPGGTTTLTGGAAAVADTTLSGLEVSLAASATGSPTLHVTDSTIAPDATVQGTSTGGGTTTLAVGGTLANLGTVTLGSLATAGAPGGYAVTLGDAASGLAGLLYNGGTVNLVGASPLITAVGAALATFQNDSLVEVWNPGGGAQNAVINTTLTGTGKMLLEKAAGLELAGAVAAGQTIQFHSAAGGNATLTLDKPGAFAGTIAGLVQSDKIVLPGAAVTDLGYAATGAHSGKLTLSDHGTTVASLTLTGDYAQSDFSMASAGGATTVTAAIAQPAASFALTDTTLGLSTLDTGDGYSGPVSYLQNQFIWPSLDKLAIASGQSNVFLHGGAGDDAISVSGGTNVLDGGAGSNFLVGATGADGGTDTFFIDGRGAGVSWGTVVNFHHGDAVTIFGFKDGVSTRPWTAVDGVNGFQGATIHSELGGAGTGVNASVTFAGVSLADAQSKFSVLTGTVGADPYLYVAYTG